MTASQDAIRVPAEWEPHEAIWLAMPHDQAEWGPEFSAAERSVREVIACLLEEDGGEKVEVLVSAIADTPVHPRAHERLCEFGDIWLRDTGPIFLHRGQRLGAAAFQFNGWGEKFVFPHDAEVASLIAELAGTPLTRHECILEGGAIDGNGAGTFLTTRECLLHANRNPRLDERGLEAILSGALGARHVVWLDRGLRGDHTDGHVDNVARFVAPRRVVHMTPSGANDPNADILEEIAADLALARTAEGEVIEPVALPSPGAVIGPAGLMAASYCNFLIANQCVVVPTFDAPSDAEALSIFADLFPKRRIVGIDACALLTGGGTVHCISQQQPLAPGATTHAAPSHV
jgi:agmatine deiminase